MDTTINAIVNRTIVSEEFGEVRNRRCCISCRVGTGSVFASHSSRQSPHNMQIGTKRKVTPLTNIE